MFFCPYFIRVIYSSNDVSSEVLWVVYHLVKTASLSLLAWSYIIPNLMFFWKFFQNLLKMSTFFSKADLYYPSIPSSPYSSEKSSSYSSGSGLNETNKSTAFFKSLAPMALRALSLCKFYLLTFKGRLSESTIVFKKLRYFGNNY